MKKQVRILGLAAAAALLASLLSACQSSERQTYFEENSAGEIVDSALLEEIEQESQPLNSVIGDHINYGQQGGAMAMSDKYAYIYWFMGDMGYIKVDLQTGEAIPLCKVAGCTHDPNLFPDCINNNYRLNSTAVGDALWHTEDNKLLQTKDGETKVLYENSYCNEIEENNYKDFPEEKYTIFDMTIDDNYAYLFGGSYVILLDKSTMQAVKIIDLTEDSMLLSTNIYKGKIYFNTDLHELYVADIESGEVTKLGDKVNDISVQDDTLYYMVKEGGGLEIFSADLDFKNSKKIASGFYLNHSVVSEGKLYYIPTDNEGIIMCHDIASGEETLFYECEAPIFIIGCADFIDRIFFCTDSAIDQETYEPYSLLISMRTDGSDLWVRRFDGETWKN